MAGLAAFAALLWQSTEETDLVVGSAFAGRTSVAAENAVGCFVNTVPLRLRPRPDMAFEELLDQARSVVLFGAEHQDVPFDHVVDRLGVSRSAAYSPLVQAAFGVRNAARPRYEGGGVTFDGVEFEPEQARLDLTLWLEESDEGLRALWTYAADLFDHGTVARLHRTYEELLAHAVADPRRSLAELAERVPPIS
jgi:non-ribosomal peptide synthetase component F